jgi:tight adherence protein C
MLMYASLFLIGLSVFLVTNLMFQEEDEYKAQEKLELGAGSDKESLAQHGIILKYSRPFFRRYVTPIVSGFKNKNKIKEKYKRKIATAGLSEIISPEDFFSFKLFLIIGFPIVFLGVRAFMEEDWALSNAFFISIFGFFYPDLWIKGKVQTRQEEILRNMPFAVDMLALSVEAGLDFIAAMGKVNEKAKPSALTKEFTLLMKEIKIGASRADALRNMAWRVDLIQVSSFCATLIAADSVGASIGPILKSLSNEVRQKRSSDIEKAGATAATKILFPMMGFILPAVLLIVGAPLIVEFMQGGK